MSYKLNTDIEVLEYIRDWDFVEREGEDIRFDYDNGNSFWIRSNGFVDGNIPKKLLYLFTKIT